MNIIKVLLVMILLLTLSGALIGWQSIKVGSDSIDKKITYVKETVDELLSPVKSLLPKLDDKEHKKVKQEKLNESTVKTVANTQNNIGKDFVFLDIPVISQLPELPSGCEITAVTMMLKYKGIEIDKITLANEMPRHSSNPSLGFVGSPFETTGYTINPPALIELVRKYAGSAVDLTGSDTRVLENYLQSKKPVVVWMGMHGYKVHAVTLCGYNDKNFYYNDPLTGDKRVAMDRNKFLSYWNSMDRKALSY